VTYQEGTAAIAATIAAVCITGGAVKGDTLAIVCGAGFVATIPTVLNPPPDNE
jgi:hypothetical protein